MKTKDFLKDIIGIRIIRDASAEPLTPVNEMLGVVELSIRKKVKTRINKKK